MARRPVTSISRNEHRQRVHCRVRASASRHASAPAPLRVSFAQNIYAQVIDDRQGRTLASASSIDKEMRRAQGRRQRRLAKVVGKSIAERAMAAGVCRWFSTAAATSITAASRRSRMRRGKRGYSFNLCRSKFSG